MRIPVPRLSALAFFALFLSSAVTRADAVPCPVQQATWTVTTPLPDPWHFEPVTAPLKEQVGAFINGKEWIICRYGPPDRDNVFSLSVPADPDYASQLSIHHPPLTNVPVGEYKCPARKIKTQLVTALPAPWTSTTYVWKHLATNVNSSGVHCAYGIDDKDVWGAGPSAILRPVQPDKGPGLTDVPKPKPPIAGDLTTEFAVTEATLATATPMQQTTCPAKVRMAGSIAATGKGDVVYRIVHNGVGSNPRKLDFGQSGSRPVAAEFTVGGPTRRPAASPGSAAGTLAAGPSDPNEHTGSARIEILKPLGGVVRSDEVKYSVRCLPSKPGSLQGRKPTP